MDLLLPSAGEVVGITSHRRWVLDLLAEVGGRPSGAGAPTVSVNVEADRGPFLLDGRAPVTRGAWGRPGAVVVEDAGTSGFDVLVRVEASGPVFTFRWRPPRRTRVANAALRARFVLLVRAVLTQYPALWVAGLRGRAPLHAAALTVAGRPVVMAGPGGVGKTSLLLGEVAAGEAAVADNLVASDGVTVWGVAEPLRVEGGTGRRMPHGRREVALPGRVASLVPEIGLVVRRGTGPRPCVEPAPPGALARHLVAGTYMAGELRRYWEAAATWALGTGAGPAQPPVGRVAVALAGRVRPLQLTLAAEPGPPLRGLLGPAGPDWVLAGGDHPHLVTTRTP